MKDIKAITLSMVSVFVLACGDLDSAGSSEMVSGKGDLYERLVAPHTSSVRPGLNVSGESSWAFVGHKGILQASSRLIVQVRAAAQRCSLSAELYRWDRHGLLAGWGDPIVAVEGRHVDAADRAEPVCDSSSCSGFTWPESFRAMDLRVPADGRYLVVLSGSTPGFDEDCDLLCRINRRPEHDPCCSVSYEITSDPVQCGGDPSICQRLDPESSCDVSGGTCGYRL